MKKFFRLLIFLIVITSTISVSSQNTSASIGVSIESLEDTKQSRLVIYQDRKYLSLPYYLSVDYPVGSRVEVISESIPQINGYYTVLDYYNEKFVTIYIRKELLRMISRREGTVRIRR